MGEVCATTTQEPVNYKTILNEKEKKRIVNELNPDINKNNNNKYIKKNRNIKLEIPAEKATKTTNDNVNEYFKEREKEVKQAQRKKQIQRQIKKNKLVEAKKPIRLQMRREQPASEEPTQNEKMLGKEEGQNIS